MSSITPLPFFSPFALEAADGEPVMTPSVRQAIAMLDSAYRAPNSVAVLTGPAGSGREATLRKFAGNLDRQEIPAVVVDGRNLERVGLLNAMMRGYGYDPDTIAADDLFGILRVFLIHHNHADKSPFLAVVHANEMHASALQEICGLAAIESSGERPLRLALSGDERIDNVLNAPAMSILRERTFCRCEMRSLDLIETDNYIVGRLKAAGMASYRDFFTDEAIARIWRSSQGLPARIDDIADRALRLGRLPVTADTIREIAGTESADAPGDEPLFDGRELLSPGPVESAQRVVVSLDGEVIIDRQLASGRYLIGRDPKNDFCLSGRYVSRRHAMLAIEDGETRLIDLKSTNGVYVNSRRVAQAVLKPGDVAQVGQFRLKYLDGGDAVESEDSPVPSIKRWRALEGLRLVSDRRPASAKDEARDESSESQVTT